MNTKDRPIHSSEVYARELFKTGNGYPLWEPDSAEEESEVMIGDVGYFQDGGFYHLFSAVNPQDDNEHQPYGVPDDFKKFDFGNLPPKLKLNAIKEGPLWSETVQQVAVGADVGAGAAGQGFNLGFRYECFDHQGAMIILGSPASRNLAHNTRRMRQYMKANVDKWLDFANGRLGLELELEHLVFVRGCVKTTHWGVVAFKSSGRGQGARLCFKGDFSVASASVDFHLDARNTTISNSDHRIGPEDRVKYADAQKPNTQRNNRRRNRNNAAEQRQSAGVNPERQNLPFGDHGALDILKVDQCVFLHYFKAKKRLFWKGVMEAAAEPRDPSPNTDNDDKSIEEVPAREKPYDPVIFLLDYILENSEAGLAIAGDIDLIDVCKMHRLGEYPIPDDIPAFLDEVRPTIEVTEEGLGMIQFDDDTTAQHIADSVQQSSSAGISAPGNRDFGTDEFSARQDDDKKLMGGALPVPPSIGGERRGGICALVYSPSGRYIAAGFEDSTIIIWEAANHDVRHQFSGHTDAVCSLAFSPDGSKLVSGGREGLVILWDIEVGGAIGTLQGHGGSIDCVAYSPNGELVASASSDSTVRLWEVETGALRATTEEHSGIIMSVMFSPDGERFVTTSAEGSAQVWSTITATNICSLIGHDGVIYAVAYSPDGRRLVTGSDDGTVRVWNALLGDEYMILRELDGSVWAAAFSADGEKLHYVGSERTIKTYDSITADLLGTVEGNEKLANSATFSADSRLLAAGGEDHGISVWSMERKQLLETFEGHTDNINQICFSPDDKYVVSASDDGSVRKWPIRGVAAPTVMAGGGR